MTNKAGFDERVKALRINVRALDRVVADGIGVELANVEGKRGSLQIYAAITNPEGFITSEEACRGLAVYGDEYVAEAKARPGAHPGIDGLLRIVESGRAVRADVYRSESVKMHPFSDDVLSEAAQRFETPVIVYDEASIRERMRRLNAAFSWVPGGFMNHIAVKATDCAPIVQIAYEEGMGVDCASEKELRMVAEMGIVGDKVMLTSNATPAKLFKLARDIEAIVNFDDLEHIGFYRKHVGELPEVVYLRYNPGTRMAGGDRIIGKPGEQKYGIMPEQMADALRQLKEGGVRGFGLHQMIVSNELVEENLIGAAKSLIELGAELSEETGMPLVGLDFGGGLGYPYRPEQIEVDVEKVAEGIRRAYVEKLAGRKNALLQLKMESGRWLTAGSGVLLMRALHLEQKPRGAYVRVDASGNDFARVEAYGCYQHLVVVGKSGNLGVYNVAGPKCENSDHWAVNRLLPIVEEGDVLALCGAGAHGHMMGSGYNGFPRCGEVMLREDGNFEMLTRPETLRDQFAKYSFPGSRFGYLARIES
jgi:diaminopimelate decarboxylase